MEWTASIKSAINYMEEHIMEDINLEKVSGHVNISPFYLEKGFKILTGYSIGEYIRNRRLYLAALDLIAGKEKVIDLALRYGYETPESFTRAFSRFHGVSPAQLKRHSGKVTTFLPLKVSIIIQGGSEMDYRVEKMDGFKVIGFEREFNVETSYLDIPKYWNEICDSVICPLFQKPGPENAIEQAVCDHMIGEYGVSIDGKAGTSKFQYLIAGKFQGGEVPDGLVVYEFPDMEWAKFTYKGKLPGSLQAVNTQIYKEWLPGNPDYELAMGANIEFYPRGDMNSINYEGEIWMPVRRK